MSRRTRGVWPAICILAAVAALGGCSKVVKERRTTTIDSTPSGAAVLASGVKLGVTPLTIHPDEVFPPRFVGFEYRAAGTLSLEKPGCKSYTRQVDDAVLSRDIHVDLECDPDFRPPAAGSKSVESPVESATDTFAIRLQRLQSLHEQGLITTEEYRRLRQKILDQL